MQGSFLGIEIPMTTLSAALSVSIPLGRRLTPTMLQLAVWNLTSYDTVVMLDDVPWLIPVVFSSGMVRVGSLFSGDGRAYWLHFVTAVSLHRFKMLYMQDFSTIVFI